MKSSPSDQKGKADHDATGHSSIEHISEESTDVNIATSSREAVQKLRPELVRADEEPLPPEYVSGLKNEVPKTVETIESDDAPMPPFYFESDCESTDKTVKTGSGVCLQSSAKDSTIPQITPTNEPAHPRRFELASETLILDSNEPQDSIVFNAIPASNPVVYDVVAIPEEEIPSEQRKVNQTNRASSNRRCQLLFFLLILVVFGAMAATIGVLLGEPGTTTTSSTRPSLRTTSTRATTTTSTNELITTTTSISDVIESSDTLSTYSKTLPQGLKFLGKFFNMNCTKDHCSHAVGANVKGDFVISRAKTTLQFHSFTNETGDIVISTFDIDYDVWDFALSDKVAVAGAPYDDTHPSGAVYVFEKNPLGGWNHTSTIVPDDIDRGAQFGHSVGVDNDGLIVVTTPSDQEEGNAGAVYVYRRNESFAWANEAKLSPKNTTLEYVQNFGVDMSVRRNVIVVGDKKYGEEKGGGVFIFEFNTSSESWDQMDDVLENGYYCDNRFGTSLAMTVDGSLLVGCPWNEQKSGVVFYYEREEDDGDFILRQHITPHDSERSGYFGGSDQISIGENNLAIIAVGNNEREGKVYIFKQDGGIWSEVTKIEAPPGAQWFGRSAAISGDKIYISSTENVYSYSYSFEDLLSIHESTSTASSSTPTLATPLTQSVISTSPRQSTSQASSSLPSSHTTSSQSTKAKLSTESVPMAVPLLSIGNCSDFVQYETLSYYNIGTQVSYDGVLYECVDYSCGTYGFEPGTNSSHWRRAWVVVGSCYS